MKLQFIRETQISKPQCIEICKSNNPAGGGGFNTPQPRLPDGQVCCGISFSRVSGLWGFIPVIIMAAIPCLILSAVLFSGCSSGGKRNTEALINQINDSTLSAEQRTLLLSELGTKALQETKDKTLWPNYAQLLISAGYASSGLKIYRDEI